MIIEKFPLQWPMSYPRTKYPKPSRFSNSPFGKSRDQIFKQLNLMLNYEERKTIILSTNIPLKNDGIPYANYRQPDDKGVAVYFQYKGRPIVICCDKWNKIEHNLLACAKTIEAMRGIDRWGVSDFMERSFQGFAELPPKEDPVVKKPWWIVMGYSQKPGNASWDFAGVEAQYKLLAKKCHPDMPNGSTVKFQELQNAYDEAKLYFGKR